MDLSSPTGGSGLFCSRGVGGRAVVLLEQGRYAVLLAAPPEVTATTTPLKVDRPLRLLAAGPVSGAQIPVRLTVRAFVTARGAAGHIPLIGRQNRTIPVQANA